MEREELLEAEGNWQTGELANWRTERCRRFSVSQTEKASREQIEGEN